MNTKLDEVGAFMSHGDRIPNHECYRHVRDNVTELLSGAGPAEEKLVVPACPEWTLWEMLAHLVCVATAAIGKLSGGLSAASSSSRGMDIPSLLARWHELGAEVDALLADAHGRPGNILVMDAFTHELDIRYAIGAELPAAHPAFVPSFTVLANGFGAAVSDHGLPALRLSTGGTQWTVGDGEPEATVTATRYDLYRSLAGRRSHHQITALGWDRGSHRWLPAFTWGPFTPPVEPVETVGLVRAA